MDALWAPGQHTLATELRKAHLDPSPSPGCPRLSHGMSRELPVGTTNAMKGNLLGRWPCITRML